MITRCLITRSEGFWWRVSFPGADALAAAMRLDGFAALVYIDEAARTVRLVRPLRFGDAEARLCAWAMKHGFRVLPPVPGNAPRPRPVL